MVISNESQKAQKSPKIYQIILQHEDDILILFKSIHPQLLYSLKLISGMFNFSSGAQNFKNGSFFHSIYRSPVKTSMYQILERRCLQLLSFLFSKIQQRVWFEDFQQLFSKGFNIVQSIKIHSLCEQNRYMIFYYLLIQTESAEKLPASSFLMMKRQSFKLKYTYSQKRKGSQSQRCRTVSLNPSSLVQL